MLKINDTAPAFRLEDHKHQMHTLDEHLGKMVLVYFYPKDDTPGCTKEACAFRDHQEALLATNCVVYGISKDSRESHAKFVAKYDLNFTLLSDPTLTVHKAYDAVDAGKTKRCSFLINQDGHIVKIWPNVRVDGHIEEVLESLRSLA